MPKPPRIRIRPVADHGEIEGQERFYTALISDGLSVTANPDGFIPMNALFGKINIDPIDADMKKICEYAEKGGRVVTTNAFDRKIFFIPKTTKEEETRLFTQELLRISSIESVCSLSFTHFSYVFGSLPLHQIRWIFEEIQNFDATDGPYQIWFEIDKDHHSAVRHLRNEVINAS
jgi:hypothetical protein